MLKPLLASFLLAATSFSTASPQAPKPAPAGTRIGTATRLVVLFDKLERQLTAALQNHDSAAIDRLLVNDFEVWTPDPPGEPIPRTVWLQKIAKAGVPATFHIRQMAVRGFDDHAVASFVLLEDSGDRPAQFVVDVWARSGTEWKLTERYASQVPSTPYSKNPKPTGKE